MTIVNPNSEVRNPKQLRTSKIRGTKRPADSSGFGIRAWTLFRISSFGLRISEIALIALLATRLSLAQDYPKPSVYPIAWELKFDHDVPKRIVVQAPGSSVPMAYWYLTYTVTNNSDKEQLFL